MKPSPWSPTWYGFDIESTGVDVFNDHIVTATVVKIEDRVPVDKRTWLASPKIDIPPAATAIHGITTEYARTNGRDPAMCVSEIVRTVVGVLKAHIPLVVFNAAYDLSLLEVQAAHFGTDNLSEQLTPEDWHYVIDPMVLGKGFDHLYKRKFIKGFKYRLPDLCDRYKVPLTDAHDATADATAATLLGIELVGVDSYFEQQSPQQIHTVQKVWCRELKNSLRAYFDKNGIEHDGVDAGWPMHSTILQVPAVTG